MQQLRMIKCAAYLAVRLALASIILVPVAMTQSGDAIAQSLLDKLRSANQNARSRMQNFGNNVKETLSADNIVLDRKEKQAIDILFERGFEPAKIWDFMEEWDYNTTCYGSKPKYRWFRYIEQKSGMTYKQLSAQCASNGSLGAYYYNIQTGDPIIPQGIVHAARNIPDCYKRGKPHKNCKPVYHPYIDCALEASWKKVCSTAQKGYEVCWDFERGDVVMAPSASRASRNKIQLGTARRTDGGTQVASANKPKRKASIRPKLKKPLCTPFS